MGLWPPGWKLDIFFLFFFLMVVLIGTQFEKEAVVVISFIFDVIIPTSSLCWWNIKTKSSVHPKPMGWRGNPGMPFPWMLGTLRLTPDSAQQGPPKTLGNSVCWGSMEPFQWQQEACMCPGTSFQGVGQADLFKEINTLPPSCCFFLESVKASTWLMRWQKMLTPANSQCFFFVFF